MFELAKVNHKGYCISNRKEEEWKEEQEVETSVSIRVFQKKTFLKLSFALLTTHAIGL